MRDVERVVQGLLKIFGDVERGGDESFQKGGGALG